MFIELYFLFNGLILVIFILYGIMLEEYVDRLIIYVLGYGIFKKFVFFLILFNKFSWEYLFRRYKRGCKIVY